MLKLDLHIHSKYSDDGKGSPEEIIKVVKKKGLNGLAITDHNTVKGGLEGLKHSSKDFIIIPGVEISTTTGHILALNVKENIPKGLTASETVDKILDLNGIPIIPHLFRNMSGIKEKKLISLKDKIDAIEIFNSCSLPQSNLKTAKVAKKYNLGGTGGSDSHIPEFAGEAYTTIDSNDLSLDSIVSNIEKKKTWAEGKTLPLSYRQERMTRSIKQFFQRGFKRI
jgi:predicted metal-dependent phosphoesterase TrpH